MASRKTSVIHVHPLCLHNMLQDELYLFTRALEGQINCNEFCRLNRKIFSASHLRCFCDTEIFSRLLFSDTRNLHGTESSS
jgi:hypothetical protein